ncbi:hypothetical protein IKJ53_00650 [bacterium]|nr:hypothetical protein [bacterium]
MKDYEIKQEIFLEMYSMIENIFGTLTLLEHYCKDFRDSEDISVIYPALKHTFIESDKLFAHFINTKYGQ